MEGIYKETLLLIHSLTQLSGVCYKYNGSSDYETGEKIVEIVDKCENNFLKVKKEVVNMVKEIEKGKEVKESEIKGMRTENGFLIKE